MPPATESIPDALSMMVSSRGTADGDFSSPLITKARRPAKLDAISSSVSLIFGSPSASTLQQILDVARIRHDRAPIAGKIGVGGADEDVTIMRHHENDPILVIAQHDRFIHRQRAQRKHQVDALGEPHARLRGGIIELANVVDPRAGRIYDNAAREFPSSRLSLDDVAHTHAL